MILVMYIGGDIIDLQACDSSTARCPFGPASETEDGTGRIASRGTHAWAFVVPRCEEAYAEADRPKRGSGQDAGHEYFATMSEDIPDNKPR